MNINHLDYAIMISEVGNLSEAARRLGVSQPVLSRYLEQLKKELGTPAFVVKNHQFILTDVGKIYVDGLRRIMNLQTQFRQYLAESSNEETYRLALGVEQDFDEAEFSALYSMLQQRVNLLECRLTERPVHFLLQDLIHHKIQFANASYLPSSIEGCKAASYYKSEVLLALPADHPLSADSFRNNRKTSDYPVLSAEQLKLIGKQAFILYTDEQPIGLAASKYMDRYVLSLNAALNTNNPKLMRQLLSMSSYGGFVAESETVHFPNLAFFRLPHPEFVYRGLIFSEQHEITEFEKIYLSLALQYHMDLHAGFIYRNELTNSLLV